MMVTSDNTINRRNIENSLETTFIADGSNQDRSVGELRESILNIFPQHLFFSDGDPLFQFPVRNGVNVLLF